MYLSKPERTYPKIEPRHFKFCMTSRGFNTSKVIGQGSYGEVYQAYNESKELCAAIKVCPEKTKGEWDNWKNLQHPNILKLYEQFSTRAYYIYIMEYADCGSIIDWCEQRPSPVTIAYFRVFQWLWQSLEALAYLHSKQLYHLDVKSDNLFLDNQLNIKLGDFGRMIDSKAKTFHVGAPDYRPPEIRIAMTGEDYLKAGTWLEKVDAFMLGATFLDLIENDSVWKGYRNVADIHRLRKLILQTEQRVYKSLNKIQAPYMKLILKKLMEFDIEDRFTCQQTLEYNWTVTDNSTQLQVKWYHCCRYCFLPRSSTTIVSTIPMPSKRSTLTEKERNLSSTASTAKTLPTDYTEMHVKPSYIEVPDTTATLSNCMYEAKIPYMIDKKHSIVLFKLSKHIDRIDNTTVDASYS